MVKREPLLTRKCWQTYIGQGLLCEEYPLVRRQAPNTAARRVDGLVILNRDLERFERSGRRARFPSIENEDIVLIQTKVHRLGMYLLGQAFFSRELAKPLRPRSIRTIAVAAKDDDVLRSVAGRFDIEVYIPPAPALDPNS